MMNDARTKYIAVRGITPSIIKLCDDKACSSYHEWVALDSRASFWDAEQIAAAMNAKDVPNE